MTKFLVSLSQSQSCFADFLIGIIAANGQFFVNQGVISTGETAAGEPTHVRLVQSGTTFTMLMYFDGSGVTPGMYFTWTTTSTTDSGGQMIYLITAAGGGKEGGDA